GYRGREGPLGRYSYLLSAGHAPERPSLRNIARLLDHAGAARRRRQVSRLLALSADPGARAAVWVPPGRPQCPDQDQRSEQPVQQVPAVWRADRDRSAG